MLVASVYKSEDCLQNERLSDLAEHSQFLTKYDEGYKVHCENRILALHVLGCAGNQ